jgi:hypothetical protein
MDKKNGLLLVGGGRALTKRGREKADSLATAMLDCLFDAEGTPYSTIISGGSVQSRTAALIELLSRVAAIRMPVIILHAGNKLLSSRLTRKNCCAYLPADKSFCEFDLFTRLKPDLAAGMLYETAKRTVSASVNCYKAIRLGCELIQLAGERCSLQNLCTFPWWDMGSFILDHQDKLNAIDAMNKLGGLGDGSAEADVFFSQLKNEPLPMACGENRIAGLREWLQENMCVCLDVLSGSNHLTIELILSALKFLRGRGYRYLTVIDSLPVNPDSYMMDLLAGRDQRTPAIYLTPDCMAVRGMTDTDRQSLLGSPVNMLLFGHMNGNSAELLSRFFGEHDDVNITTSTGTAQQSLSMIQKTISQSRSAAETRRRNIMPEELQTIPPGIALVFPVGAHQMYMPIRFAE